MVDEKKDSIKQTDYHQSYYEPLDSMYPDVYYRCYPYVKQACEMYDNPDNPGFYPYPTRTAVDQLTDYVYQRMNSGYTQSMDRQYYGGGILRPLLTILIIRELLRRRRPYYYY
ncbi:MAG: hypothetical protein FH756_14065 [Firmicutes bacterium]|nr:hypothetical protein [Bacillota bacterium]